MQFHAEHLASRVTGKLERQQHRVNAQLQATAVSFFFRLYFSNCTVCAGRRDAVTREHTSSCATTTPVANLRYLNYGLATKSPTQQPVWR